MKKYWYKTYIYECPVCGKGRTGRERQYGPVPNKYSPERYEYIVDYDWCNEL